METTAVKTKWAIDPMHSELTFTVKHLMISNVKGKFRKFEASVESEGNDFSGAKVKATIDPSSIDTNSGDRDNHLKSGDFFDAVNHKDIKFEGTTVKSGNG